MTPIDMMYKFIWHVQPKLDIFRGVEGHGLGVTKSVDTPAY